MPSQNDARAGWRPRHGTYWLIILPALAMLVFLYLVPLADVLVTSITDPKPGLDNYLLLFTSTSVQKTRCRWCATRQASSSAWSTSCCLMRC